jgi:hypothetical protein
MKNLTFVIVFCALVTSVCAQTLPFLTNKPISPPDESPMHAAHKDQTHVPNQYGKSSGLGNWPHTLYHIPDDFPKPSKSSKPQPQCTISHCKPHDVGHEDYISEPHDYASGVTNEYLDFKGVTITGGDIETVTPSDKMNTLSQGYQEASYDGKSITFKDVTIENFGNGPAILFAGYTAYTCPPSVPRRHGAVMEFIDRNYEHIKLVGHCPHSCPQSRVKKDAPLTWRCSSYANEMYVND